MKRRRALLVTFALSAALVAAVVGLRRPYTWFLARHWGNRLETVPEERVDVLVEGIARLGEPGIPVLVEALGSKRQSVAGGARRVLAKEMGRWESLRAKDYSPKLAILAEALADQVNQLNPAARAEAADLAARILRLWTLDEAVVDPAEVIACCEKVLRTPNGQRPVPAQRPPRDQLAVGDAAGGPLLREPSSLPVGLHQAGTPGQQSDSPLAEPRRLDGDGARGSVPHSLRPFSEPESTGRVPEHAPEPAGDAELTDLPRVRPLQFLSDGAGPSVDLPGGGSDSVDLAALDTVELMRRLQAADDERVAAARAELTRRGFTEVHLALARQLFHPDPGVRARLGRVLLRLPNVDAVPWLVELSRDEDAGVRLAAMALMATTGDPVLLQAVEKSARQDPDPRVQRQAERIARKRRTGGY